MQKKNLPFLTIGLPFYNNEKTLANAIKSVLLQSYKNWELILVDDGSTDKSVAVAKEFARADERIKVVTDGVNRGLVHRLNQIIDLAEGDYIARMDSDDMMMPAKLERQMKILTGDPGIDVIDTGAYIINEKDEPVGMRKLFDLSGWNRKKVLQKRLLFHPTIIAKKSWCLKNKYDENFVRSEDFELWCRAFEGTRFYRIYEPLFMYREGNVNIKAYAASSRSHRKAVYKHRPGVLNGSEFVSEIVKSHLKSFLYQVFGLVNKQHILAAKRNVKLSQAQVNEVRLAIKKIKNLKTGRSLGAEVIVMHEEAVKVLAK